MKKFIILISTIVIIPLALHGFGWDHWTTSILCAVIIAFIEQIFILNMRLDSFNKKIIDFNRNLHNQERTNNTISLLSSRILELSFDEKHDKDIFVNFYIEKLKTLSDKVNDSINTGRFEIDYNTDKEDYAQLSKSIFRVFNKNKNDYFYTISESLQKSIDWFFNINNMSNIYLSMTYDYLKQGKISSVKRLFVYKNIKDLDYDLTNLLIRLHLNSGFDVRFITYDNYLAHINKEHLYSDFGIYGNHFVFENNKNHLNGETQFCGFSIKRERIDAYSNCFKTVWDISYSIRFSEQIVSAKIKENMIILPHKKFDRKIHELKFDDIDKIQSIICEKYRINN